MPPATLRPVRWTMGGSDSAAAFYAAYAFLFDHREDYATAAA
jgi:hypothetical protein